MSGNLNLTTRPGVQHTTCGRNPSCITGNIKYIAGLSSKRRPLWVRLILQAGRDAMRASEDLETSQEAAGKSSGDSISSPSGDAASAAPNTNRRLAIRTRFIDDFFEDCVLSRGIKQVSLFTEECAVHNARVSKIGRHAWIPQPPGISSCLDLNCKIREETVSDRQFSWNVLGFVLWIVNNELFNSILF